MACARTSTSTTPRRSPSGGRLRLRLAADFAHVFDVKAGLGGHRSAARRRRRRRGGSRPTVPTPATQLRFDPAPDRFDAESGTVDVVAVDAASRRRPSSRSRPSRSSTASPAGLAFPIGLGAGRGDPDAPTARPGGRRCHGWCRAIRGSSPRGRPGAGRHRRAAHHRRRPRRAPGGRRRRAMVHDACSAATRCSPPG